MKKLRILGALIAAIMSVSCLPLQVSAEKYEEFIGEYNPLGIDWDDFFSVDENAVEPYVSYTLLEETPVSLIDTYAVTSTTYESENNDSISAADVVSNIDRSKNNSVAFKGRISTTSDSDYIKITPPRHGVLQIQLTPPSNTCLGLYLYDSSGKYLNGVNGASVATRNIYTVTTKKSTLDSFYIRVTPGVTSNNTSSSYYTLSFQYVNYYSSLNAVYPFVSASGNNILINSPVGYRSSYNEYHTGLDIDSTWDCQVRNIVSGEIIAVKSNGNSSNANYVVVKADTKDPLTKNDIYIRYYHLNSVYTTTLNSKITAGTVIGTVGNTGLNKSGQLGKHLHIDMNCVPSDTGSVIRNSPNRIINPIDLYSYPFTGTLY